MKILFLSDNFPPESNAPATRTYDHCRIWASLGAQVTVITCVPNFPRGEVYAGYRNLPYQREVMDGIEVIRVWTYMAANVGFARRVLDYLSFAASSVVAGAFVEADVIVATSPQFFTTLGGVALAGIKRKPWVFEVRDLWPDSIRAVSAVRSGRVLDALERLELWLYERADLVVAVTPAFERNLISRGVPAEKIEVVTNGANLSMFGPRAPDERLRAELGLHGKFVVGYVGTHGMAHNLDGLFEACERCDDPGVVFLSIGDGANKAAVEATASRNRRGNLILRAPVPKDEIARYWSVIDAALVPLRRDVTFTTVIPSKIFEAAAMGKPILLGVEGQARELVERYDAGLCFTPEDGDALLAQVARLRADAELYRRLGENGLRLAAAHDRETLARRMYAHLERIATR